MYLDVERYEVAGVDSYGGLNASPTAFFAVEVNKPKRTATQPGRVQLGKRRKAIDDEVFTRLTGHQNESRKRSAEKEVIREIGELTREFDSGIKKMFSDSISEEHSCLQCDKSYVHVSSLRKHMAMKHGESAALQRDVTASNSNKSWRAAMETSQLASSLVDTPYQCTQCCDQFSSLAALEAHMKVHLCEKPYKCSLCSMAFSVPAQLENHVKSHSSSNTPKLDLCASSSSLSRNLDACKNKAQRCQDFPVSCKLENNNELLPSLKRFKCDLCMSSFKRKCDLNSHKNNGHRVDKPHRCSVCRKNFRTSSDLEFHKLYHTEKPYRCTHCDWTSDDFGSIRSHVKTRHSNERPFECSLCEWKFITRASLRRHLRNRHGSVMCGHCNKVLENDRLLKIHLQEHRKGRSAPCPHCKKTFTNAKNLRRHMPMHDKRHVCTQCCRTFVSVDEFEKHLANHDKIAEKLADVNNRRQIVMSLTDTSLSSSLVAKAFICNICGKVFTKRFELRFHMPAHDPKPYGCRHCGSNFRYVKSLQNHVYRHRVEDMLKCTLCNEEFSLVNDIESHLKSSHTGSYKCSDCDEFFWAWKDLRVHKKSQHAPHAPRKDFCCPMCDKAFVSRFRLNGHLLRLHSEAADFNCPSCMQIFFTLKQLNAHMRNRHSKPQFCCDRCAKMFRTKCGLEAHVRRSHEGNDSLSLDKVIKMEQIDGDQLDAVNVLLSELIDPHTMQVVNK